MKKLLSILTSAAALTILAACGGGGGDSTAVATGAGAGTTPGDASRYLGTWSGCTSFGTSSEKETVVITPQAAEIFAVNFTDVKFAAPACAGPASSTTTGTGTVALSGTKTIGADTVDKGIVTQAGQAAEKQVFLVKGTGPVTLSFGRPGGEGGPVDAEGYPNTLDSFSLTKE